MDRNTTCPRLAAQEVKFPPLFPATRNTRNTRNILTTLFPQFYPRILIDLLDSDAMLHGPCSALGGSL